jgi:hypothetical protein
MLRKHSAVGTQTLPSIPADGKLAGGTVKFTDSDAGVNWAQFDVVQDKCSGCFTPFAFDPGVSGLTQGQFNFDIWCKGSSSFLITLKLTLKDVQGHVSNPYPFSFECRASTIIAR